MTLTSHMHSRCLCCLQEENNTHFFDLDIRDASHQTHFFDECQGFLLGLRRQSILSGGRDYSAVRSDLNPLGTKDYNYLSGEEVRLLASHFKGNMMDLEDPSLAFAYHAHVNPEVDMEQLTERTRNLLSDWGSNFR